MGDELNFHVLLDQQTYARASLLAPECNMFDLKSIHHPSDACALPKPVAGTIANWLEGDDGINKDVLKRMQSLAM